MSSIHKASVRQDEERVIVIVDGKAVLDLPWEAALEIGQAICQQARRAEEIAKATLVIRDQAIVLRAGVPIGLAVDPRIQREAEKEAAWSSELRRYMPGGVKSQERVGTPRVRKHKPRR